MVIPIRTGVEGVGVALGVLEMGSGLLTVLFVRGVVAVVEIIDRVVRTVGLAWGDWGGGGEISAGLAVV